MEDLKASLKRMEDLKYRPSFLSCFYQTSKFNAMFVPCSDDNAPKKLSKEQNLSSYILYFSINRAAIQAANPSANVTEIGKLCAAQWNSLSDPVKQMYADESNKIKEHIAANEIGLPQSK